MDKKTKILCTIGPATWTKEKIEELYKAGMNIIRLNCSHGNHELFEKIITMTREISPEIAVLLDNKGPEIRIGMNAGDEKLNIVEGREIIFTNQESENTNDKVYMAYEYLTEVDSGCTILVDDGLVAFEVLEKVDENSIKVKCLNTAKLGSKKTVTIWGHEVKLPIMLQKDIDDLMFGIKMNVDFYAASFIRTPEEVKQIRELLDNNGGSHIKIISKIEHGTAVENLEEVVRYSDGLMVARGDLAVEVPLERVPELQIKMIDMCRNKGKPVIVATQMLESMQENPRPTRAETADVANAIMQGTDCVMLSGETANGKYPVEAVKTMAKIAKTYDDRCERDIEFNLLNKSHKTSITKLMAKTAYDAAEALDAAAIIIPTKGGLTARNVARFRPKCPIYALTGIESTFRQLKISKGVFSINYEVAHKTREEAGIDCIKKLLELGKIKEDDRVIVVSGVRIDGKGHTNLIEAYTVSDALKINN